MSQRIYTDEYFENKVQQGQIKKALLLAIPEGVYFHNLLIALAELLADNTRRAFTEEVFTKRVNKPLSEKGAVK